MISRGAYLSKQTNKKASFFLRYHSVTEYSKYGAKYSVFRSVSNKNPLFLIFFQNPDVKHALWCPYNSSSSWKTLYIICNMWSWYPSCELFYFIFYMFFISKFGTFPLFLFSNNNNKRYWVEVANKNNKGKSKCLALLCSPMPAEKKLHCL